MSHKKSKKIGLLSTGNEIVCGQIQEANGHYFAKKLFEAGANIYQKIQTTDIQSEIQAALSYLLNHCDAVIITGGLGPTSDDVTRYALADAIQSPLIFNEEAWQHVVDRLSQRQIDIHESNRQQALFPAHAEIYLNPNGSACGCCLVSENKLIFMLPGPPKECWPMFENHVYPYFQKNNFFEEKIILSWLISGLPEGSIASEIDKLVKPYSAQTGYRWDNPYLEIKITLEDKSDRDKVTQLIDVLLKDFRVRLPCQNDNN